MMTLVRLLCVAILIILAYDLLIQFFKYYLKVKFDFLKSIFRFCLFEQLPDDDALSVVSCGKITSTKKK